MASSADISGGESSAAQQLLQKHAEAPHHVTIEDAEDPDLPAPSQRNATASSAQAPAQKGPSKSNLDTQSHELFPELGASKGKSANVAPVWGAKSNSGGKANGASPSIASPPPASTSPAAAPSQTAKPSMFIPGRNVESVTLEPRYVLQRGQLKRPIPDIIKDLNRKSRANISMSTASNGRLKFDATGPQEVAQQALKDLVQQIGTRVCPNPILKP